MPLAVIPMVVSGNDGLVANEEWVAPCVGTIEDISNQLSIDYDGTCSKGAGM